MKKSIPIFLATDDNYAPFAATMMFSVLSHTKSVIDFYILDGGITDISKTKIEKTLARFKNKTLHYIDMSKFDLSRFPNVAHYSLNTFSRYFIPEIMPDLDKVLYMDVDIIVTGDIALLYNQDLEGHPVGAVLEDFYVGNYTNLKRKIWPEYRGGDKYFNAGVMLLDIQQFRKNNWPEQLVDLTIKLFKKLCCPDQDVFNILFENNFKVLDYKFNYMPDLVHLLVEKHPECWDINPLVIHYTVDKPWRAHSLASKYFDDVLAQTEFADDVASKWPRAAFSMPEFTKPVLLLTFNRFDYLQRVFNAVAAARPTRLYIASDGARENHPGERETIEHIRKWLVSHVDWDCQVKTRFLDKNSGGCAAGVSGAVSWFFENEPEGIILEDDCVPNLSFFRFCEQLLEKYRDDKRVWHIAGDAPIDLSKEHASYYFARIQHCWGWASWADRWQHFTRDLSDYGDADIQRFSDNTTVQRYWKKILTKLQAGEIDSWAYPWTFNIVRNGGLCINPSRCLVSNIGITGVHYTNSNTPELNKPCYEIRELVHPTSVAVNQHYVDRIYREKFLNQRPKMTHIYRLFGFIPVLKIEEL